MFLIPEGDIAMYESQARKVRTKLYSKVSPTCNLMLQATVYSTET